MDFIEFKKEITKGTGKAFLMIKKNKNYTHPEIDKIILDAAKNNLSYDPQCEGSRAIYISHIISEYKNGNEISNLLINYFKRMRKDDWGAFQVFELMKLFFLEKKIDINKIYKKAEWYITHYEDDDTPGIEELIDLEKEKGFLFIAEVIGKIIEKNSDFVINDWPILYFEEKHKLNANEELKEESKKNKYVLNYLNNYEDNHIGKLENQKKRKTVDEIIDIINIREKSYPRFWCKNANTKELLVLADFLDSLKDEEKIKTTIQLLSVAEYPKNYQNLLKFLDSKDENILRYTLRALSRFKNNEIRNIALEYLNKHNIESLIMLKNNFLESDCDLIYKKLKEIKNPFDFHDWAKYITDIFKINKTKRSKEILEYIYRKLYCGICRTDVVKAMMFNNLITDEIKEETKYDSFIETREIFTTTNEI
ncbi:hypothetical protein [Spirochaeta cellobiosiphila]|uniref:hypothetical protein n=1 Tax=Spirochaeta cellobiosiphila TaxID=504483 RepID=UPI0004138FEE|nr:hypothetical protein [Spirochaeta cellobiosiphila]